MRRTAWWLFVALGSAVARGETYYDILGVPQSATAQQIKRAYYKLAKTMHRAPPALLALGALAIALFGIGVPLLYACLLYACRAAIQNEEETPLSASLAFLHGSLHPWALWWPLVEAARALLLTGFLALVEPGQIFQLLCGLLVAFGFSILQVRFLPYRTPSNNVVAMVVTTRDPDRRVRRRRGGFLGLGMPLAAAISGRSVLKRNEIFTGSLGFSSQQSAGLGSKPGPGI